MRDREAIDSELRRVAALRRSIREHGGEPSSRQVDELLDERLGHRAQACEIEAVEPRETTPYRRNGVRSQRRKGVLRRFGLLAALPVSLTAVAAMLVVMFAVRNPNPAAQPTIVPPSGARPNPTTTPKAHIPPLDIVDKAFIDALKQESVPVPSHEYATTRGHAVCDFLAHQPNVPAAISFVQRSSIWDANQSADIVAGAIVSYCPQYETASPDEMQQTFQNVLSDLQAIEGDLQGIRDRLNVFPGQH